MDDPRFEPLPEDENKHAARMVRDLAWGVLNDKWQNRFYLEGIPIWDELSLNRHQHPDMQDYLERVWDNKLPNLAFQVNDDYLREVPNSDIGGDTSLYRLTDKALKG